MRSLVKIIDTLLATALIFAMSGILLAVIWQVISRYVLQDPASVTEELARFLLIWIGILGAAYAYRQKAHLGFNLIVDRQRAEVRRMMMTLVEVLVIVFSASVLLFGGKELMVLTLELNQISAALNIRMGYIYSVLPIAGCIFIFYSAINIYNLWVAQNGEPL